MRQSAIQRMLLHGNTTFDMRLRPLFLEADVIRKEEKEVKESKHKRHEAGLKRL